MINVIKIRNDKKEKANKGITLIALVITIIVLLILVAVSIATLTGENGILTKASDAKTSTVEADEKEQIKLAYNATIAEKLQQGNDKVVSAEELKIEITKQNTDITVDAKEENKIEIIFNKTGNQYIIDTTNGEITKVGKVENLPTPIYNTATTVQDAIQQNLPYENKTEIQDSYGNKVVVPEGFKIPSDSASDVTGGVVIEDVTNKATAGSQFVWIPVGEIKTASGTKIINLSRYTFATNGTPTEQGEKVINTYWQELTTSSYGNTTAKNIEDFKTSATTNHGYYIGRYEARVRTQRTSESQSLEQVTVKSNDYVYNFVTQIQAATLAQGMYPSSNFTSDLMNSYAWDTAIVFIQNFGKANYSMQNTLVTALATQGTNNLTDVAKQDKQLNIWDMSSNVIEWTTETSSSANLPCVLRGGNYSYPSNNTSYRSSHSITITLSTTSFRAILYL